ncbi:hypothetical protein M2359_002024 [Gordonia amarae]|nr:hypothetical protein [Gordonia amarae]
MLAPSASVFYARSAHGATTIVADNERHFIRFTDLITIEGLVADGRSLGTRLKQPNPTHGNPLSLDFVPTQIGVS